MRVALAFFVDALINFGILAVSYPIWWEFSNHRSPLRIGGAFTLGRLLSSAILTALESAIYALTRRLSWKATVISQIVVGFLVLSLLSVVAGSSSSYAMSGWYPLEDITAIFFGELQVITFIPKCATTMGIASGVLLWAAVRKRTSTSPKGG